MPFPSAETPVRAQSLESTDFDRVDFSKAGSSVSALSRSSRASLLILLNPGRFTRHYLFDMAAAAERLGIRTVAFELSTVWEETQAGRPPASDRITAFLREHNVAAVIGSGINGLLEWPVETSPDGRAVSFFERMGIPHLMWWTDHPQWANERFGLRPEVQPPMRSHNQYVFVKSALAARELREVLGWPNCHGLPVAENAARLQPAVGVRPDFDVVAVVGSPPRLDPELEPFLSQEDPDVVEMASVFAPRVWSDIMQHWKKSAPIHLHAQLERLGHDWVAARAREPLHGSYRIFTRLAARHVNAARWVRDNPAAYFDAVEALWELARWQRTFYLRYLARHFRVGVFGCDWSSVGIGGDSAWVGHDDQPAAYARGRVAINISQPNDEEGVSHKPFQIAACGVPMIHVDRKGLADCFTPGRETAVFATPRQAREAAAALLADPDRSRAMADAARERLCREHTWETRLSQMLSAAGVDIPLRHSAVT